MLFEVFRHNDRGEFISYIDYRENSQYVLTKDQIAESIVIVRKHRYESKSKFYGVVKQDGKAYMIPEWTEIHPEATYKDIYYKEPKKKVDRKKLGNWEFKSSSSNSMYMVKEMPDGRLTCDCWGFRAHRKCKHVKEVAEGRGGA